MEFTDKEIQLIKYALDGLLSDLNDSIDSRKITADSHNNMVDNLKACNRLKTKLSRYMKENSIEEDLDIVDLSYIEDFLI